jgi:hypothetical protein
MNFGERRETRKVLLLAAALLGGAGLGTAGGGFLQSLKRCRIISVLSSRPHPTFDRAPPTTVASTPIYSRDHSEFLPIMLTLNC